MVKKSTPNARVVYTVSEKQRLRRRVAILKRAKAVCAEVRTAWGTGIATAEGVAIVCQAVSLTAILAQQEKPLTLQLKKAMRAKPAKRRKAR